MVYTLVVPVEELVCSALDIWLPILIEAHLTVTRDI